MFNHLIVTVMKKNVFTAEFYKNLYNKVDEYLIENHCPEYEKDHQSVYIEIEDGDDVITVEMTVYTQNEWRDDSFNHAFGTWNDPYPCYEYGGIDQLKDVTVWFNDDKVEGFNIDAFWAAVNGKDNV